MRWNLKKVPEVTGLMIVCLWWLSLQCDRKTTTFSLSQTSSETKLSATSSEISNICLKCDLGLNILWYKWWHYHHIIYQIDWSLLDWVMTYTLTDILIEEPDRIVFIANQSIDGHLSASYVPVKLKLQHPPPWAIPWAFEFLENFCSNSPLPRPKSCSNAPS